MNIYTLLCAQNLQTAQNRHKNEAIHTHTHNLCILKRSLRKIKNYLTAFYFVIIKGYTIFAHMSTVIYPSPIFGPVHSRRLGISLGINLMPADGKVCTFDCIYCECGFNADHRPKLRRPTREEVAEKLEAKLKEMKAEASCPMYLRLPETVNLRLIHTLPK